MLQGIYTALTTPFTADGGIYEAKTAQMIECMVEDGIAGVVIGGSTGEFFTMTLEQRKQQVEMICRLVNKRITVIAGAGCLSTEDTVDMAKFCTNAGADILLVVPSFYETLGEDIYDHYAAVGKAVDTPIMLYNIPGSSSNDITPEVAAKLAKVCNATCMKDSTGNLDRQYQIEWATNGAIQPVCGWDTIVLGAFASGTKATILGVSNAVSKECVALYKYMWEKNDLVSARKLWDKLMPVFDFAGNNGYISVVKALCKIYGRDQGDPKAPIGTLSEEKVAVLKKHVDALRAEKDLINKAFE